MDKGFRVAGAVRNLGRRGKSGVKNRALVEDLEGRVLLSSVTITPQDVLTYHTSGNPATTSAGSSTGYDGSETVLTTGNVNSTDFGKQFTATLDGQVYAQPLAVANVDITTGANLGIHNVIFVATMNDSLFAIDANTGVILWQDSFVQIGNPQVSGSVSATAGVTTVPGNSTENAMVSTDIGPELGIIATPVVDAATNTIYLVADTQERRTGSTPSASGSDWHFVQRLWALSMSDGSVAVAPSNLAVEPTSGGQVIGDTILDPTGSNTYPSFSSYTGYEYVAGPYIKGTGDNGGSQPTDDGWIVTPSDPTSPFSGTTPTAQDDIAFNAVLQMSRTGLSLINGVVYFGFASHGDDGPYYGWILGYSASTLANTAAFVTTPTYESFSVVSGDDSKFDAQAGVWMSGGSIVTDGTYLYLSTGNGAFNPNTSNFSSSYYSTDDGNKVLLPLDGDYGDAILKLAIDPSANQSSLNLASPPTTYTPDGQNLNGYGLKVADFFVPSNEVYLNYADEDLGSGGVTLLPPSVTSTVPGHVGDPMLVTGGKEGRIYLIDQDNMGGYNTAYPTTFSGGNPTVGPDPSTYDRVLGEYSVNGTDNGSNQFYSTASYFPNGSAPMFFVGLGGSSVKEPYWQFNVSSFQAAQSPPGSASANTPANSSSNDLGIRNSTSSISANGSSNALVWVLDVTQAASDALLAYTYATSPATELYTSNTSRDTLTGDVSGSTGVKFSVPTVFNGMVYGGTGGNQGTGGLILGTLVGYGLLDSYLTSNASFFGAPSSLSAAWAGGATPGVQLSWKRNSTLETEIEVDRSTNGTNWSVLTYLPNGSTSYLDTSASAGGTYYYRVRAISGANSTAYSNGVVILPATVANQYMFYYGSSAFDKSATSPSSYDYNAIAENANVTDKTALLPGQTGTFANVSSYSDGINGILIDFGNEAAGVTFTASDFAFAVGNNNTPSTWATAPAPTAVATWIGPNGDTFADITWANNAIQEEWLQVTVLADANTHLASNDVFYFGSLIGATGTDTADGGTILQVTAGDLVQTQNNASLLSSVPITNLYDYNRDGYVTAADFVLCQNNATLLSGLEYITPPSSSGPAAAVSSTTTSTKSTVKSPTKTAAVAFAAASESTTALAQASMQLFSDEPISKSWIQTPVLTGT